MNKALIGAAAALALFIGAVVFARFAANERATAPETATVAFRANGAQASFAVIVADSDIERIRGLSKRDTLDPFDGMLFIFEEDGFHGIWMKDMRFPIDIVWLDRERVIVSSEENVTPATFPKVFAPTAPARYVLEVPAGTLDAHGLAAGDAMEVVFR